MRSKPLDVEKVRSWALSGKTCAQIAARLAVKNDTVYALCGRNGIKLVRDRTNSKIPSKAVLAVLCETKTIAEIACRFGASTSYVGTVLRKHNLKALDSRRIDVDRVRALAESGKTGLEISKDLNRRAVSIYALCDREGISLPSGRRICKKRKPAPHFTPGRSFSCSPAAIARSVARLRA